MGLGATLPNHIPACRSEFKINFRLKPASLVGVKLLLCKCFIVIKNMLVLEKITIL